MSSCNHTWHLYEGITNRFEYCTQCDAKKGDEDSLEIKVTGFYELSALTRKEYAEALDFAFPATAIRKIEDDLLDAMRYMGIPHVPNPPLSIEGRIAYKATKFFQTTGMTPTHAFICYDKYQELRNNLGAKRHQFEGVNHVVVNCTAGPVKVVISDICYEDDILIAVRE